MKVLKRLLKCSMCCNTKNHTLTELWKNHAIVFDADDKGEYYDDGICKAGYPYAVECSCGRYGYTWKLRKVTQITDILEDKDA